MEQRMPSVGKSIPGICRHKDIGKPYHQEFMRHILLLLPLLFICQSSFSQSPTSPESTQSHWDGSGEADNANSSFVMDDLVKQKDLEVYPNPCTGLMVAKSSDPGKKQFSIIDMKGRIVGQSKAKGKSSILDLTDLPSGVYMVRAENPETGYASQHKVVKH